MDANNLDFVAMGYHRVIVADEDVFLGKVLEFPGCFAIGSTDVEALANLKDAADSWIAAALEMGQTIPPPIAY